MNKKVTLQQLAALVSRNAGISIEEAEKWTRAYFDLIADTLAAGENVKIKGLGNFKLSGIEPRESIDVSTGRRVVIPGHLRAGFTPEKSVAQEINAPFASFEAVELADNLSESELDSVMTGETGESPQQPSVAGSVEPAEAEVHEAAEVAGAEITETAGNETAEVAEAEVAGETEGKEPEEAETEDKTADEGQPVADTVVTGAAADTKEADEEYGVCGGYRETAHNRKSMFLMGFLVGLACIFLVLAAIWCWYRFAPESYDRILGRPQPQQQVAVPAATSPKAAVSSTSAASPDAKSVVAGHPQNGSETNLPEEAVAAEDAKAEVPTQPSDAAGAVVYDTISRTRFLTTMARDHYGSYHLWPYIYMENSKILGHPDRIRPGTRVVIPPASKYGISASDKACVAKAKKMGVEIYARYR